MKKFSLFLFTLVGSLAFMSMEAQNYSAPNNPSMSSSRIEWISNFGNAQQQASQTGKPILIFFTGSNWCTWCIKLEREVLNTSEFAQAVGDKFIFVKADFPDYTEEALAASPYRSIMQRYHVEAFPTLVIINPNGQLLFNMSYEAGGPRNYVQKLLQKLNSSRPSNQNNYYYR